MKFIRTTYPDYPGAQGSPCWKLEGTRIDIDADWNTRFPFGTSFGLNVGRQPLPMVHEPGCSTVTRITAEGITGCRCEFPANRTPGFLLDLNAPLGEPNRLYLWLRAWHVIIGGRPLGQIGPKGDVDCLSAFKVRRPPKSARLGVIQPKIERPHGPS